MKKKRKKKRKAQLSDSDRGVYLKHIARLQERNRLLAEVLVEERHLRKRAYRWYQDRLKSRWLSFFDWVMLALNEERLRNKE